MSHPIAIGVFVLLLALLFLLSLWQRKIREAQGEESLKDLDAARQRGADRPSAQHPQVDPQSCIGCGSCIVACPEEGVLGLVDGVAQVIHGSRCIGHALCAEACPIGAIKIGLGHEEARPDLPILSERLETSFPGIYAAGELTGLALIRVAARQGIRAIDEIAADLTASPAPPAGSDLLDVLVVGAGPAGIAASLRATERSLRYSTIDQEDIGGTVRKYPRRKLTLTGAMALPLHGEVRKKEFLKEELIDFWEELIGRFDLDIRTRVRFLGLQERQGEFVARTSEGPLRARRILLALGRRGTPRKLDVPGEELEKVLYQLVDAATYENQRILIVGGGDSAVEAATALANQPGNSVTLSYRRDAFFRLNGRNQERLERYSHDGIRVILSSRVERIDADSVTLACGEPGKEAVIRLDNDYVIILAGGEPPYQMLRSIGVRFGGDDVSLEPSEVSEPTPAIG